jgi:hypothetical protein
VKLLRKGYLSASGQLVNSKRWLRFGANKQTVAVNELDISSLMNKVSVTTHDSPFQVGFPMANRGQRVNLDYLLHHRPKNDFHFLLFIQSLQ